MVKSRAAPPATSQDYKRGYALGHLIGTLIVPVAVVVAAAAFLLGRKRKDPGAPSA